MTPVRRKRAILIALMLIGVSAAAALILVSFNQNLMFFFTPSEVVSGVAPHDKTFRLGGMVVKGSLERKPGQLEVSFRLTDMKSEVTVRYNGILPDLFREGQGIVSHGKLSPDGVFVADEVLAKHDENYMPPQVSGMLRDTGKSVIKE